MPHTEGPWKVAGPVGAGIWITDESSNNQIAIVYGEQQTPDAEANAHLIAAAPDLLKALRERVVRDCNCHQCQTGSAAIRKALAERPQSADAKDAGVVAKG